MRGFISLEIMVKIALLYTFTQGQLHADLSPEGIKAAIDDASPYQWILELGEGCSAEIVDDPTAENGTSLKIIAPANAEKTRLSAFNVISPAVVSFRLRFGSETEAAVGVSFTTGRVGAYDSGILDEGAWSSIVESLDNEKPREDRGLEFEFPRFNSQTSENSVFYIDGVRFEDGARIERVVQHGGGSVAIFPDEATYGIDQIIEIGGIPEDGNELFEIKTLDGLEVEFQPLLFRVINHARVEAIFAKRFDFPGGEILVPLQHEILESPQDVGDPLELVLKTNGFSPPELRFRGKGPGILSFKAVKVGEVSGSSQRISYHEIDESLSEYRFFFGPDAAQADFDYFGYARFSDFQFEPAIPIAISQAGEGSIDGIPSSGYALPGELLVLEAQPAPNWFFGGWKGDINTSDNEVSIKVDDLDSLEATFFQIEDFRGFETRLFGHDQWAIETDAQGDRLVAKSNQEENIVSSAVWPLVGPGKFSIEYEKPQYEEYFRLVLGDREFQPDYESVAGVLEVEIPEGEHLLEAIVSDDRSFQGNITLSNPSWVSGYPINISTSLGGMVNGQPENFVIRAMPNQTVDLTALPQSGYVFKNWYGGPSEKTSSLQIEVLRPMDIHAVFEKIESVDGIFQAQYGDAHWTKTPEEEWLSPFQLHPGESATLRATIEGPSKLILGENSFSFNISYRIDGGRFRIWTRSSSDEGIINIPEGFHDIEVRSKPRENGEYQQARLDISLEYLASIRLRNGILSTTPFINYSVEANRLEAYLPAGDSIFVQARSLNGIGTFSGWPEAASAFNLDASYTLDRPVVIDAYFSVSEVTTGDLSLSISNPELAYIGKEGLLGVSGMEPATLILSEQINGPALLSIKPSNLESMSVLFDGEVVERASRFNERERFLIPAGDGKLEIILKKGATPENRDDQDNARYGIQEMYFDHGYFVDNRSYGGGQVQLSPDNATFDPGTTINVSVNPILGHQFSHWIGDFSHESRTSFSFNIDSHKTLIGAFPPTSWPTRYNWTFDGHPPVEDDDVPAIPGRFFLFHLAPDASTRTINASTVVEGPAKVSMRHANYLNSIGSFSVSVDNVHIDSTQNPIELLLREGPHDIAFTFEGAEDATSPFEYLLELLILDREVTLEATSKHAQIARSPDRDIYTTFEPVTATAPPTNDLDQVFKFWQDMDTGEVLGINRQLNLEVDQNKRIEAIYNSSYIVSENASISQPDGLESWTPESTTPSPENALTSTENSSLELFTLHDCTLSFSVLMSGKLPSLRISSNREGLVYSTTGVREMTNYQFRLKRHDELTFEFSEGHITDEFRIQDVRLEKRWGPTIIPEGMGQVVFNPDLSNAKLGQSIVASISNSSLLEFQGWNLRDQSIRKDTTLEFVFGEDVYLNPIFDTTVTNGFGSYYQNFLNGWIVGGLDGPFGPENRVFHTNDDPSRRKLLSIDLNGPGYFKFETNNNHEQYRAFINERPRNITYHQDTQEYWIAIPIGKNTLTIEPLQEQNVTVGLSEPSFIPIVRYDHLDFHGGRLAISPEKYNYNIGDKVFASAYPNGGYNFSGWEAPYEDKPISFSISAGVDPKPIPRFARKSETIALAGLEWTVRNGELFRESSNFVDPNGLEAVGVGYRIIDWDDSDLNPTISTTLSGPSVLTVPHEWASTESTLNGSPLFDINEPTRYISDEIIAIPIPEGPQELTLGLTDFQGLSDRIHLYEGYHLSAIGIGCDLMVDPVKPAYRLGEIVSIKAQSPDSTVNLEWRGAGTIPEGTNDLELIVSGHTDIRAINWQPRRLFALDVWHAGNRQWTESDEGHLFLDWLASDDSDHIKWIAPANGIYTFEYDFRSSDPRVKGMSEYNGYKLDSFENPPARLFEKSIPILEPGATISSQLFEISKEPQGTMNHIRLESLEFEPIEISSNYLSWWNSFSPNSEQFPAWITPEADPDSDGVSTYAEYLIGTDPLRYDSIITIQRANPTNSDLTLRINATALELLNDPVIELSNALGSHWVNAETLLTPIVVEENAAFSLFDLELNDFPLNSIFFRLNHSTSTPPIEELLMVE